MVRTQVYFPDELHQQLRLLAQQRRTSVAELMRQSANQLVQEGVKRNNKLKKSVFSPPSFRLKKKLPWPLNREAIYEKL